MSDSHKGGCFCGAVRYETVGKPVRVSLCHCRYCQLRTGTALVSVFTLTASKSPSTRAQLTPTPMKQRAEPLLSFPGAQNVEQQFLGRFLQVPLAIWSQ